VGFTIHDMKRRVKYVLCLQYVLHPGIEPARFQYLFPASLSLKDFGICPEGVARTCLPWFYCTQPFVRCLSQHPLNFDFLIMSY